MAEPLPDCSAVFIYSFDYGQIYDLEYTISDPTDYVSVVPSLVNLSPSECVDAIVYLVEFYDDAN